MEVETSSNVKFFQALPEGKISQKLGQHRSLRSLRLQSTVEIFLTCELMGGRSQRLNDTGEGDKYCSGYRVHMGCNVL